MLTAVAIVLGTALAMALLGAAALILFYSLALRS